MADEKVEVFGADGGGFATPQVASVAAAIWGANPSMTNQQVADLLRDATPPGGALNAVTAVLTAQKLKLEAEVGRLSAEIGRLVRVERAASAAMSLLPADAAEAAEMREALAAVAWKHWGLMPPNACPACRSVEPGAYREEPLTPEKLIYALRRVVELDAYYIRISMTRDEAAALLAEIDRATK